jgi:NitT/TauT family transport system substrate-binding protein/putative hydroxymethylpyrimidine transport system substrate-binding protein
MKVVAALLAAALLLALAACSDDGAEPGEPEGTAPSEATLVLDFQPNAVHAGLYAARARGYFSDEGIDLQIQQPTASADGAKLLEAGRADFAILDINDLGLARQRGLKLTAIGAIVQRPLAAVIAADGAAVRTPADLAGSTVGVTGVPSDDAVLDTVLSSGGVAAEGVTRQTIGFQAVPLLAAGTLAAATGFWSSEGVELRQQGLSIREFRVDEFGAPRYPELVLVAPFSEVQGANRDSDACLVLRGLERGYDALADDPNSALDDLLAEVPEADPATQGAQLAALVSANAFANKGRDNDTIAIDEAAFSSWLDWAGETGVLDGTPAQLDTEVLREGVSAELLAFCKVELEPLPPAELPTGPDPTPAPIN